MFRKREIVNDNVTCNTFFPAHCPEHNLTDVNVTYDSPLILLMRATCCSSAVSVSLGYEENSTATVVCEDGFISVGYTTKVTCTSSGNWSDVFPQEPCYPGNAIFLVLLIKALLFTKFNYHI